MKKKRILVTGIMLTMVISGIGYMPERVYAEEIPGNCTVIDFENLGLEEQTLTEKYAECNFGNMGWNTGEISGDVKLWADSLTKDEQVNKIAIPYGKIFRGFSASCAEGATIKVVAGSESNSFNVGAEETLFTTDFTTDEMAVYIVIKSNGAVSDVKFDDLVLEDVDISKMNIAKGKAATTSGENEQPASNGNDGNYNTMWINNGGGANKWWQVDLERAYRLSEYELTFEKDESNPWKYKIEASNDGSHFDLLVDKTENQEGERTQTGVINSDIAYRYVRVMITGLPKETYWCGFSEFKLFTTDITSNVAWGKETTQSAGSNSSSLGVDGDGNTFAGNTDSFPYWWTVDLGNSYDVKGIEIEWEDLYDESSNIAEDWKYKVEYSNDNGATWNELLNYTKKTPYVDPSTSKIQHKECDIQCDSLKVTITDKPSKKPLAWAILPEFRVFAPEKNFPEEEGQKINIDIAYGQPVNCSSFEGGCDAANVSDYKADTSWKPLSEDEKPYLQFNLDREYDIRSQQVEFVSEPVAYKFLTSMDGVTWTENSSVSETAGSKLAIDEVRAKYVRFEFEDAEQEVKVKEVHFDGLDAGISSGKRILVLAPHEDDEMLMAGGIMKRGIEVGDEVKVALATNGDYNGKESGEGRIIEAINALGKIGLDKENILFMGYADTGGLGGAQTYQDSFLYKLYTADDQEVLSSRWGNQYTYGNESIKQDYHYEKTGEHAVYTRENFLKDLESIISEYEPTDIYVPSRYDMHFDHAYFDLFAIEAIQNVQKAKTDYNPTLHESIIHSCAGDSNWPTVNSDDKGLLALDMPKGLEELTMFKWDERENVNVPYSMRQMPFAYNLKDQALRLYTSQYYDYIGSFAKVNEIFWTRDFSSFAKDATVTASSQLVNSDKKIDQSAVKVIDGVRDGLAAGLPYEHPRYPHAEWVTETEREGAWINLEFEEEKDISKIVLYDRPNAEDQILSGKLIFDDGTEELVGELPNDGSPLEIQTNKKSKNIKFVITSVSDTTKQTGLAEIEVY